MKLSLLPVLLSLLLPSCVTVDQRKVASGVFQSLLPWIEYEAAGKPELLAAARLFGEALRNGDVAGLNDDALALVQGLAISAIDKGSANPGVKAMLKGQVALLGELVREIRTKG